MDESEPLELASLLCSRLCHDMLSPVGAINNGLELLASETDPHMRDQCLQLLEQSAQASAAKLKFFRLAYGAAGGFGDAVAVAELQSVIEALAGGARKVEINWVMSAGSLPKPAVKVLLNLAQIALDSLVRGGSLDIGAELRKGAVEIVVRAQSDRIAFDEVVGRALEGALKKGELTSRTANAHMIALLAAQGGGSLQYRHSDQILVLGAVLPQPHDMVG